MVSRPRSHSQDPYVSPTTRVRPEIAPPAPLPVPLASLVGREGDVETVRETLLRDEVRLVTLTGPGGVGKSRLGLAAGTAVHAAFADGVRLVRLAAITDDNLVLPAIESTLGLRDLGGAAALESLQVALHDREMLLLLDNFEQVVGAGADLADLLRACPRLKALVTSRARLRLRGEHVIPVLPLAVPEDDVVPDPDALRAYPAVELFVQRGREIRPDLVQTPHNAAAVAGICRRLDGLPLAIELAAARLDILPPPVLLERLQQRLPVLVGGARDLPDRLRTLRDAIAWSHDLLHDDEQRVFRGLAVFTGGFTTEAAAAVSGMPDELTVLDVLGSLTDKSLLRLRSGPAGDPDVPRYGMLETIREFAREMLVESAEEQGARERHADFFLDFAESSDPGIYESGGPFPLDRLERDHDNLRAALGWYRESGDREKLLRLAGTLGFFWYYRGYLNEGRRWLDLALQAAPDDLSPRPRAWALTISGLLENVCGETERAAELLTESFAWWARTDDARGDAVARGLLGGVLVGQGEYDQAEALFETTLHHFREAGHHSWAAHSQFHLGVIACARGDDERARVLLQDSVASSDKAGSRVDAIDPLRYLGLIACNAGDHAEAAARFGEVLMLLRQRGSRAAIAVGLADAATFSASRGKWETAARLFATAEILLQAEGAAFSLPARTYYDLGRDRARAALGDAAFTTAAVAGRQVTLDQALAQAEAALDPRHDAGDATSTPVAATSDDPFTERERDVLHLLAAGKSNPEIADALFIGRGTVRTHVSNILGKLGAKTRTEASMLARDRGLL